MMLCFLANHAVAATAAGYAGCVAIDEILFNRKLVPSAEISQKISGLQKEMQIIRNRNYLDKYKTQNFLNITLKYEDIFKTDNFLCYIT